MRENTTKIAVSQVKKTYSDGETTKMWRYKPRVDNLARKQPREMTKIVRKGCRGCQMSVDYPVPFCRMPMVSGSWTLLRETRAWKPAAKVDDEYTVYEGRRVGLIR